MKENNLTLPKEPSSVCIVYKYKQNDEEEKATNSTENMKYRFRLQHSEQLIYIECTLYTVH